VGYSAGRQSVCGRQPHRALPEIWSFGLRNPWRYTFDDPLQGGTGALVIGDVGQNRFEEIDYEPANRGGRNYGWRNREGAHDNVTSRPVAYQPLTEPIFELDHSAAQSITGGFVYRGNKLDASFKGRYFLPTSAPAGYGRSDCRSTGRRSHRGRHT
jgi:glucose/arabinose dehydrogenase